MKNSFESDIFVLSFSFSYFDKMETILGVGFKINDELLWDNNKDLSVSAHPFL